MSAALRPAADRCANCGAPASWNYCPQCGQETAIAMPTAFAFLRDAAGRYVRFDGRMWRSLAALLFRPGFLTREYLAGRRRRYVRPARLFVALSILLFALMRFEAGPLHVIDTGIDTQTDAEGTKVVVAPGGPVDRDLGIDLDLRGWRGLAPIRTRIDAFNRLPRDVKADQVMNGLFRYAPYAAIGLRPCFALLVAVAFAGGARRYPERPRRYAAHLVFGAHVHAFAFIVVALAIVVPYAPLRFALQAWAVVYVLVALKSVYGGHWLGVVARAAVIALAYLVLFALASVAVVAAAVLFR
jgi:rRNA maturation protein Nop10